MTKIPHARTVSKALAAVRVAVKRAQKGLNELAGQRMAKRGLRECGGTRRQSKRDSRFQSELEMLFQKWRELSAANQKTEEKQPITPLWQYFQPILRILVQLGGQARRPDLEAHMQSLMAAAFLPGDTVTLAHGRERWRIMVRRARKHLVAEGWIESHHGPVWKITEAGRNAAEKAVSDGPIT